MVPGISREQDKRRGYYEKVSSSSFKYMPWGRRPCRVPVRAAGSGKSGADEKAADREDADSKTGSLHANPGIPGLPDNLSRERVLIVGEQVIAGSLRCSLREDLGAQDVTVLCPTKGSGCMAEEGDMLVWDEDEAISRIGRSTVVIADPLYRQVCPGDGQRIFVDFPHEACSGRMYHSAMRPFICGS